MADLVAAEHDGGGGEGEGSNKKRRKRCSNFGLRKLWTKNGCQPIPIEFEDASQGGTWKPIGDNGDMFISLVGTLVREVPYRYDSWAAVPDQNKTAINPTIEMFFDMTPHKEGPFRELVEAGIQVVCSERYRGQKSVFKSVWYKTRLKTMSIEELRRTPPPNMDLAEWTLHLEYFTREDVVRRANSNTEVRKKQVHQPSHGRQSFAQYRRKKRDPVTLKPPSIIDHYKHQHIRKGQTEFTHISLAENHRRMEAVLRDQSGSENPMSEAEILTDVLGPRRTHVRGIGRKVTIKSSSTSGSCAESVPSTRMYTQSEVDAMLASQQSELDGKLKDQDAKLKAQQTLSQAIVDAMRQAGISVNIPSTSLPSPEVDLECDDLEDSD